MTKLNLFMYQVYQFSFSSVQSLSHVWLFVTPWTAARQAFLSITNSQSVLKLNPLGRWCHPTISSSVIPFSSHLQSFPASGSFQMSHFFTSGGQCIGVSTSGLVLPMNIQEWFPLGWTGWISLQSKGLSRVFSNTTVQKHQFFSTTNSSFSVWILFSLYIKTCIFLLNTGLIKILALATMRNHFRYYMLYKFDNKNKGGYNTKHI